jgi:hypothetical protein
MCQPITVAHDVATWIQVTLSAVTIGVLIFTWRAANAQAKAARTQAEAAEKLITVTEAQRLSNEKASAALIAVTDAQRRAAEDSVKAAKEQSAFIKAQLEESLRPILSFEEGAGVSSKLPCIIRNEGRGTALDLTWWYGRADEVPRFDQMVSTNILGPEATAKITVNQDELRAKWITIQYRATDGRGYQTFVSFMDGRMLQVQHTME